MHNRRMLILGAIAVAVVVLALILRAVLGSWGWNKEGSQERQRVYDEKKAH
jgi:hypothetical protein